MVDVHLGADAEGAELAPYTGRHRLGTELDHQQVTQRVAPGPQLQQHPVELGLGMDQRRDRAMVGLGAQEDWKARRLGVVLAAIDGKRVDAGTMKRPQQLEASHDPRRIIEAGQARGPQRPVGGGGQPLLPGCQPLYVGEYERRPHELAAAQESVIARSANHRQRVVEFAGDQRFERRVVIRRGDEDDHARSWRGVLGGDLTAAKAMDNNPVNPYPAFRN